MNILLELKKDIDLQIKLLNDMKLDEIELIESDTEKEIEIMKENIINDDDNIEIKKCTYQKQKIMSKIIIKIDMQIKKIK